MPYDHLKSYVAANYPYLATQLTDAQYEQIAWTTDDTHKINEMAVPAPSPDHDKRKPELSVQQKRIFARLNCLYLLCQGEVGYKKFVAAQSEPKLESPEFASLSALIRDLTPIEYEMLWVATTVSMSATAAQTAERTLGGKKLPFDAVNFLAIVMTQCPRIYPAVEELLHKYPAKEVFVGLDAMFDTGQLLHMMYAEGTPNMFAKLKHKIASKNWSERLYNLWFNYWLIDITGFRGHIDPRGSCYLNQNTFRALISLKNVLDRFQTTPNPTAALKEYLNIRAAMIELSTAIEETPRLILARIAAMLRLFSPAEGAQLQSGLRSLEAKLGATAYCNLITAYNPLVESDEPTPTFGPALFVSLIKKCGIADAIKYGLPVYALVLQQYRALRADGELSKYLPLNLSPLANPETVEKILAGKPLEPAIYPSTGQAELFATRNEQHTLAPLSS